MSRYVMRANPPTKSDWWWDQPSPPHTITHPQISEGPPIDTGLLDADGRKIYRCPDEIGFLPRREEHK